MPTNTKKPNQSIEDLNSYIHVIHPSVWLLIVAMLSILVGILVWSFTSKVNKQVDATVYVSNNQTVCYVHHEDSAYLQIGMNVTYASTSGELVELINETSDIDTYLVETSSLVTDGYYDGVIIYDEISPISFLLD